MTLEKLPTTRWSDVQLFELMAGADRKEAEKAWDEFARRYCKQLYAYCKRCFGHRRDAESLVTLVNDVFVKAFRDAPKFKPSLVRGELAIGIVRWLGRRASWIVRDEHRQNIRANEKAAKCLTPPNRTRNYAQARDKLTKALSNLTPKDRDILLTCLNYFDLQSKTFEVPDEIQDSLCAQWNIGSRNTLCQIRKRAFDKIKSMVGMLADVA